MVMLGETFPFLDLYYTYEYWVLLSLYSEGGYY